ncbi:unnamed protein product, partial [Rotaria sp. Silwood2]
MPRNGSSKEKMLQLEHLKVKDQIFSVHKPHRQVKLIRLLNIPSSISNDVIRDVVSKWKGTIVTVECECLPRPFSSIKTFVRRIRMKFESPNDEHNIPISFKLFGIVHHSTPISSDELPSTPTVVGIRDADDFESPQLSATQECIATVTALPPCDQEEQPDVEQQPAVHQELDVQQQPNIQQQPGVQQQSEGQQELDDARQIMLGQDNIHPNDKASNMINQAPSINFIEAYQMYKDGQNVLKRPRHDENNITINESKK